MRIHGYRIHRAAAAVEVWEWSECDVPLAAVLQHHIVSSMPRPAYIRRRTAELYGYDSLADLQGPLGFRTSDGTDRKFDQAVVVASNQPAFVEFLADGYVPLADGQIEQYLRRAATEKIARDEIRRTIDAMVEQTEFSTRALGIGRASSWGSPLLLYLRRKDLPGARLETDGGPAAFINDQPQVLCYDYTVRLGGIRVPRRAYAIVSQCSREPVICWDAARFSVVRSTADLPPGFLARVDREGTALDDLYELSLGGPELEPQFLLRVPAQKVLNAARERRPREPAFRRGAFLFDSRSAVPLPRSPRRLPYVDDPRVARYILCRTTPGGVYVPGAAPSPEPVDGRDDRMLVGALPAEM